MAVKGKTSRERAINKAMELGAVAHRVDARTYTVPSCTSTAAYTVTIGLESDFACTCVAGQNGRTCYHVAAVQMAVVGQKLERPRPTAETSVLRSTYGGRADLFA